MQNKTAWVLILLFIYNQLRTSSQLDKSELTIQQKQPQLLYTMSAQPIFLKEEEVQSVTVESNKHVYVIPGGQHFPMFQDAMGCYNMKDTFNKRGYHIHSTLIPRNLENPSLVITFDVPIWATDDLKQYPIENRILFTWEPPTVNPYNFEATYHAYYSIVYTWNDDLVDNEKYFKFYYWPTAQANSSDTITHPAFENKKLCVMINANKNSSHPHSLYGERRRCIDFFERYHPHDFDLYGNGWEVYHFTTYRGGSPDKLNCLRNYKFCICYENITGMPGYITEKILDCFIAGCVPIYWGAPNVTDHIPKNCFITPTDFKTYEELYQFMNTMTQETYNTFINNINHFLKSDTAQLYTLDNFVKTCNELITRHEAQEAHMQHKNQQS